MRRFLSLLLLLWPLGGAAQSASDTMTPEEVRSLRLLLAEGTFLQSRTDEARADLVALYEQEVGRVCMPYMTSELSYFGSKGNSACNNLIDKLFAVDPENPQGICARDGLDTRSCRTAYAKVEITTYKSSNDDLQIITDRRLRKELDRLRIHNQKLMDEYEASIAKLNFGSAKAMDDQKKAQLRSIWASYLAVACANTRLRLEEAEVPSEEEREAFVDPKSWLSDDDELLAPANPGAEPQVSRAPPRKYLKHTRLLADRCARLIDSSLSAFPGFPPALCQRWGYYSPPCIDAKRVEKRKREREAAASGKPPPSPPQEFKTF